MEQLLHYVWKHKLFPLGELATTDGQPVEVLDPGMHNADAGPDFFNAKVKIGGTLWVGNVEIHLRASDWYAHGHDRDGHYDSVALHVVGCADAEAVTSVGRRIPQMELSVPAHIASNYQELFKADRYPPCHKLIPTLPRLTAHSWMAALQMERLQRKTDEMAARVQRCGGSWEDAYFATLARNFGFGVNGDAFETWALGGWLPFVAHHRDNLFQVEAMFMGQAGLLDIESIGEKHRADAAADNYFVSMQSEYSYLAHKFRLTPMDHRLWRFLRLRPQNFPYIRLSQLANLYHSRRAGLSQLLECDTIDQACQLVAITATPYWHTHYTFGAAGRESKKAISPRSAQLIVINTLVPTLFAYGRHRADERLCQRALDFLEQLKAEDNNIVRMWRECGLQAATAADSQALIQLKRQYCDRKDCLRCRIGYEYLKRKQQ